MLLCCNAHRSQWPEEEYEELEKLRPFFPVIQRMQTWMHHVSRYDGWFYDDKLVETRQGIENRRKWIELVAKSLFDVMTKWQPDLKPK